MVVLTVERSDEYLVDLKVAYRKHYNTKNRKILHTLIINFTLSLTKKAVLTVERLGEYSVDLKVAYREHYITYNRKYISFCNYQLLLRIRYNS